jgi:hypothetical protein
MLELEREKHQLDMIKEAKKERAKGRGPIGE